jgi:hypothetical protein
MLPLDVSMQQIILHLDVSVYKRLCFTCACMSRALDRTCTCLPTAAHGTCCTCMYVCTIYKFVWFLLVRFETGMFVSNVSISVRTRKQNEQFILSFRETNLKNNRNILGFGSFRLTRNIFLFVFEKPCPKMSVLRPSKLKLARSNSKNRKS